MPGPSKAANDCINCECSQNAHFQTRDTIVDQSDATRQYIADQFEQFIDDFFEGFFWKENLLAAMRGMTEQLVSTGLLQIEMTGAFFDAKNQLETQQLLQSMEARAHKDYQTDMEMCTLGTASRGLGSAFRNGQLMAHVMAKRTQDRMLGVGESVGGGGRPVDKDSRFNQVRSMFCDSQDHFGAMAAICNLGSTADTDTDLSYAQTVGRPLTINAMLENAAANNDEPHIFALAANLYANDTPNALKQEYFSNPNNLPNYLDVREITARRNVAEFSFDSIAGMKISDNQPAADIGAYVAKVYTQLGFSDPDARTMVGQRPSYNALMEVMNKTLYMRPEFYINLYTKPANIARIGATIRAANLMQDMDEFNSQMRMEMNLSQILESEILRVQDGIEGRITRIKNSGPIQQKR